MSYLRNPENDWDTIADVDFECYECEHEETITMDVYGNGASMTAFWEHKCPNCGKMNNGDVEL